MHHAVPHRLRILPVRALHVPHPGPAQRQRETIKTPSVPVAEVAPVHLRLLPRRGLEPHERPLLALAPPGRDRPPHLCRAASVAALPQLHQQLSRVAHSTPPTLPQIPPNTIPLPTPPPPPTLPLRS